MPDLARASGFPYTGGMFFRESFKYLRAHPWQRRMVTMTLAMLVALGAVLFIVPYYRQRQRDQALLAELANPIAIDRLKAVYKAVRAAKDNPVTFRRLVEAIDTPNDRQFTAIVEVLRELGRFDRRSQPPERLDRLRTVEYELTQSPQSRALIYRPALLTDRDNAYLRRALKSSLADPSPELRVMAATLAAKLGGDEALRTLMKDADPKVAARAALDAGIAGRVSLRAGLVPMLDNLNPEVVSAAAFSAIQLDAPGIGHVLFFLAGRAQDADLRDRLMWLLPQLKAGAFTTPASGPSAPASVGVLQERIAEARVKKAFLPGATLIAAARLNVPEAPAAIRDVLEAAGKGDAKITIAQTIAAIDAAEMLKMPVRAEVYKICESLWSPKDDFQLLLVHAARALGRQAAMPQGDRGDTPTRHECERLLQYMARFMIEVPASAPASGGAGILPSRPAGVPLGSQASNPAEAAGRRPATTGPAASMAANDGRYATTTMPDGAVEVLGTPIPSAAAAVALWDLNVPLAEEFVREATVDENSVVGDYVVWEMAMGSRKQAAFEVGLKMLPALATGPRVYFENERAAGAMLLALSAGDDNQRKGALDRIVPRLKSEEMDFVARGSYGCAALILGQKPQLEEVRLLLETGFPQRRCLTALLAAGDKQALDWLLWSSQHSPEQIAATWLLRGVQDVTAAWAPSLPHVDASAEYDLRMWQVQILRDAYVIHRASLKLDKP